MNTFLLPGRVAPARDDGMPSSSTGPVKRPTILVVDDDGDQRAAVVDLLELAGYQVTQACDGEEALALLHGGLRPVLIVLDLTMPRMSGWTFLELLRGTERSAVPVLVTSGDLRGRAPPGADAWLDKPVDGVVFRATVARLSAGLHEDRPLA